VGGRDVRLCRNRLQQFLNARPIGRFFARIVEPNVAFAIDDEITAELIHIFAPGHSPQFFTTQQQANEAPHHMRLHKMPERHAPQFQCAIQRTVWVGHKRNRDRFTFNETGEHIGRCVNERDDVRAELLKACACAVHLDQVGNARQSAQMPQ
jgi:hypothetical protein